MAVYIKRQSKAEKGDTLSLRISSKDKFALDLLAQKQGLTLSAAVMQALQEPLREHLTVVISEGRSKKNVYLPDVAFDPLTSDRIVKLAMVAPEMLTVRQQVEWKVIQENPTYWGKSNTPKLDVIRNSWEEIQSKAEHLLAEHAG